MPLFPPDVVIREVGLRDGLQSIQRIVPTHDKIEWIRDAYAAGQREIVRDGVDGYRWSTLDELRNRTLEVAGNPALRTRLAHSARERAQLYSDAAFADNVRDQVKRHDLL